MSRKFLCDLRDEDLTPGPFPEGKGNRIWSAIPSLQGRDRGLGRLCRSISTSCSVPDCRQILYSTFAEAGAGGVSLGSAGLGGVMMTLSALLISNLVLL